MAFKRLITVTIEKLVFGGQGMGRVDNKVYFVWNALPGEVVTVEVTKKKKNFCEGYAVEIIQASPQRVPPQEEHYGSCSPWQILSPSDEQTWKVQLAKDSYFKFQQSPAIQALTLVDDLSQYYGYRNKMEYSFTHDDSGALTFGFFKRGTHWRQPIQPCVLASTAINRTAQTILDWLKTLSVTDHNLKSLIILSNEQGETIAGLFVRDHDLPLTPLPTLTNNLGFTIYFSNPRSPASIPTAVIEQRGSTTITDTVLGTPLQHDLLGFFQVNVPIFAQALQTIATYVDPGTKLLDCYGGVGAISLPLQAKVKSCIIIESNVEATAAANHNIQQLGLTHYTARCVATEQVLEAITSDQTVIVDPPRAGLHDDVTGRLLTVQPRRIIYLSCNLSTQARDVERLLERYVIRDAKLFNFFPRTPHIEGLIVLDPRL
ncbi:MAG: class I SAM-dependent RNA methyltransferase [Candidatus Kerfeldbacteria bacterium]|nr:class I SAM-dependent RNA methyltransferase [Candidatus Kerfeldbacteria bacterium]